MKGLTGSTKYIAGYINVYGNGLVHPWLVWKQWNPLGVAMCGRHVSSHACLQPSIALFKSNPTTT